MHLADAFIQSDLRHYYVISLACIKLYLEIILWINFFMKFNLI